MTKYINLILLGVLLTTPLIGDENSKLYACSRVCGQMYCSRLEEDNLSDARLKALCFQRVFNDTNQCIGNCLYRLFGATPVVKPTAPVPVIPGPILIFPPVVPNVNPLP